MSPAIFPLLGVAPAAGRFFRDDDAVTGAARVVVISHALWQSRFGGDASAVGRTMQLDGEVHEIVGIAPAWFYFPDRDAQMWTPYVLSSGRPGSLSVIYAVARLKPGVTVEQAAAEGTAAARSVTRPMAADLLFGKGAPVEVRVRRLVDEMTRTVRPAMLVLLAAVGLVLLIACANVANLLLARGIARSRELAVRAALGAGRGRLARQLLTESVALSLAGGALGMFLAWGLMRALPAWAPDNLPRLADVRLDVRVLAFTVFVSVVAGALAGLFPALGAARTALTSALRSNNQRSTGGSERVRNLLLASEAAVSVVLLIGAALLVRSFVALVNVNPGYDPTNVLTGRVYLSGPAATPERRQQIVEAIVDRLRSSPGVLSAGAGSMAPLNLSTAVSGFDFRPNTGAEPVTARALYYVVTPGYAEALGLRRIEGRLLEPQDSTAAIQAMVVNDAFVKSYLNDGRPVAGRRYQGLLADPKVTTEIVGVVGSVLKDGLDRDARPEMSFAHSKTRGITRENQPPHSDLRGACRARAGTARDRARGRADCGARRGGCARLPCLRVCCAATVRDRHPRRLCRARADSRGDRPLCRPLLQRVAAAARDRYPHCARRDSRKRRRSGCSTGLVRYSCRPSRRSHRGSARGPLAAAAALRRVSP